jgi:LPXTG-site transpeptidase (sortase) family protein
VRPRRLALWAFGLAAVVLLVWGGLRLRSSFGAGQEKPRTVEVERPHPTVPPTAAPVARALTVTPVPLPTPDSLETPAPSETPAASFTLVEPEAQDFRLWAPERIQAYQASLQERGCAPTAVLRIPSIGLEVAVLEGTDDLTLNRAVGRIAGTARPGEAGNVGIAGHRDGFFRVLKDLAPDSPLELETLDGRRLCYRVQEIRVVRPSAVEVLDPTPEPSVTLVTCYPFYFAGSAPERFIVRAVLASP